MKKLIIETIQTIEERKKDEKRYPFNPTEHEVKGAFFDLVNKELDSLIEEGIIVVTGITVNKHRLLTIKKPE